MLVLSRKPGEQIVIDKNIIVTVTDVQGDKVKLGFEAPDEVIIDRMEIHEIKKKELEDASK